jgi:hypothetical protein
VSKQNAPALIAWQADLLQADLPQESLPGYIPLATHGED